MPAPGMASAQGLLPRVLHSLSHFRGPFAAEAAEMGGNQALL
jgi:hypothetical protein